MDKFVVDLDKVLDDFEKNEEEASQSRSFESSGYDSFKSSSEFPDNSQFCEDIQFRIPVHQPITQTGDSTPTPETADRSIVNYLNEGTLEPDKVVAFDDGRHLNGFQTADTTASIDDNGSLTETMTDSDSVKSLVAEDARDMDFTDSQKISQSIDDNIVASVSQVQESTMSVPSMRPNVVLCKPLLQNNKIEEVTNSFPNLDHPPTGLPSKPSDIPSTLSFGFPAPNEDPTIPGQPTSRIDDQVSSLDCFQQQIKSSFRKPQVPNTSLSTPTEDVGYSRVPGMPLPRSDSSSHETDTTRRPVSLIETSDFSSTGLSRCASSPCTGQVPPKKKARPNSLLGLSVPTPPSELVRIEQEQKSQPIEQLAPSVPCQFTLPLPPNLLSVGGDLSPSHPSPKSLASPMDCYEEIENPLYRNTESARPEGFVSTTSSQEVVHTASSTLPSPSSKGMQRPSFLPIPVSSGRPVMRSSSPGSDISGETETTGGSTITSSTEVTLEAVTPDALPSPLFQSDSVSGDSPTASIASSASSAWSGIADDDIGRREPTWARDESSSQCMSCGAKFTVWRRRHHCRACGKLLCGQCCSWKSKLDFLKGSKGARVCAKCFQQVVRLESSSSRGDQLGPGIGPGQPLSSPQQQPISSALKRHRPSLTGSTLQPTTGTGPNSTATAAVKSVMFSDGIRPGGDLCELDSGPRLTTPTRLLERRGDQLLPASVVGPYVQEVQPQCQLAALSLVPSSGLPPLVVQSSPELFLQENPQADLVTGMLTTNSQRQQQEPPSPVVFAVTRNLHVLVTRVELTCCGGQTCWCFSSRGLETIGQEEVVILLECAPQETLPPRDVFQHYFSIYEEARTTSTPDKKSPLSEFSCLLSHIGLFNTKELAGFLYIRPTYQCLQNLLLPPTPFLIGILIHRWEAPWAKLFPLRLLLRMGIQARYYPCPLVSKRDRGPLFAEVGHTVLQLLADFRDYRYTLPTIPGLWIHLSSGQTKLQIPKSSYSAVMKVMTERQEDSLVLALGGVLSREADSHLVCVQKEDEGTYTTQAISIENTQRKVTGASFIVFNGNQRQTRCCIVEDGVIVQLKEVQLRQLISQLQAGQPVTFQCDLAEEAGAGQAVAGGGAGLAESISICWTEDASSAVQLVHQSWVDNSPIAAAGSDGGGSGGGGTTTAPSFRVPPEHQLLHWDRLHQPGGGGELRLTWTRVYTLQCPADCEDTTTREPVDCPRLADELAAAIVSAIGSHLGPLREQDLVRIAVRVTLDPEQVGYEVGCSNRDHVLGLPLPGYCLNDLDTCLVPVLHPRAAQIHGGPLVLELLFHILD